MMPLFLPIKAQLPGRRFSDIAEIQERSLTVLQMIPKLVPAVPPAVAERRDPLRK
jgi:hypothetical protein